MVFSKLDITGIDMAIMHIFPPMSIFPAIALSPASLQILTANSVKIAIPVTFNKMPKNSLPKLVLLARLWIKETIPEILSKLIRRMRAPANKDTYRLNSGLYCFSNMMIITEIKPDVVLWCP